MGSASIGRKLTAGALALGLLLVAGCATVESRIGEHADLFASLDGKTQATLLAGRVELGYTMAMAYIALGNPDEIRRHRSEGGESFTWVYWYVYPAHYHGHGLFYPYARRHHFAHDFYYYHDYPYYETRDYLRLVFVNGRITSIEEIE